VARRVAGHVANPKAVVDVDRAGAERHRPHLADRAAVGVGRLEVQRPHAAVHDARGSFGFLVRPEAGGLRKRLAAVGDDRPVVAAAVLLKDNEPHRHLRGRRTRSRPSIAHCARRLRDLR